MDAFFDFLIANQHFLTLGASTAGILLVIVILLTPLLISAIPDDYFKQERRRPLAKNSKYPFIFVYVWGFLKNVIGAFLVLCGIAMLILPGQGVLTIFVGLLLMNYPGKYKFERWIVSLPKVLVIINWIRRKQNKTPLTL